MPVANSIRESIEKSSWIRKMFEEGARLKTEFGAENVYDFSLGNPDIDPPAEFFDVLKEFASEKTGGIHSYMPNAGYPDVRKSIAARVTREQQTEFTAEGIIMTCGAAGGMNVALKSLLNPGDEVIVIKPYFVEYGFYISNHGGRPVFVESAPGFSLDIKEIEKAITPVTKAVILNSPNNPTGKIYSAKEIKELADILKPHNSSERIIYIISDEPYRELAYNGIEVPPIPAVYPDTVITNSYSKSLSIPGERIGYAALPSAASEFNDLIAAMTLCNRVIGFVNAPALMQRIAGRLVDCSVDVELYRKRRDLLTAGLKKAGYRFAEPEGAFYIFCESPDPDDVNYVKHLQKYNILTVPGVGFGGPGYFRICYCVPDKTIEKALPLFEKALREWNLQQ